MGTRFVVEKTPPDTPVRVYVEDGGGGSVDMRFSVGGGIGELVLSINSYGKLYRYKVREDVAEKIGITLDHNRHIEIQ